MNTNHKKEKEEKKPEAQAEQEAVQEKLITLKEEEYNRLKEEVLKSQDHQERLLRMQADFDNARKRMEKQCQDFTKYATEGIISELLGILDDLERTTQNAENKSANLETFLKGIEMILAHLYEMLKKNGVKPIEVEGRPFDPHTSEALMQVDSELPEHTVVEELQKGYFLNDRVLRTAKVKVATAKAQKELTPQNPQKN